MSVQVHIHRSHRQLTDGKPFVEVAGTTVGECLQQVIRKHPGMKEKLFDKKGNLLNIIEIYINTESAYPGELVKKVAAGDEIYITAKLAGG